MSINSLLRQLKCRYHRNALLKNYSSWRIGGFADWLVEPENIPQLSEILRFCHKTHYPSIIIGYGTNLLFDDAGFRGIVIRVAENMSRRTFKDDVILAQAGAWVPRLALDAGRAGLTGLEHIIGIPGTLGGLVAMNGGSRRKSIAENVTQIRTMDFAGNSRYLTKNECAFSYRSSIFQERELVIVEAELQCEQRDPHAIRREMLDILRERGKKFPRKEPNCGSVFANDNDTYREFGPPGKIIERAGLKGVSIGDAQVSTRHANFIVNKGRASASDVLALIHYIRSVVYQKIKIWLRCEVQFVEQTGFIATPSDARVDISEAI